MDDHQDNFGGYRSLIQHLQNYPSCLALALMSQSRHSW